MAEAKKQPEAEPKAESKAADKPKVEYTKPTSQLDLERRLKEQDDVQPAAHLVGVNPSDQLDLDDEKDDGFIGVDPVYRNYANDTEKPLQASEGVEAKAEELHWKSVYGEATVENEQVKENLKTVQSATRSDDK